MTELPSHYKDLTKEEYGAVMLEIATGVQKVSYTVGKDYVVTDYPAMKTYWERWAAGLVPNRQATTQPGFRPRLPRKRYGSRSDGDQA